MSEHEYLLNLGQEEILHKIWYYSAELVEIIRPIVETGHYTDKDGTRIHDLADMITKEKRRLFSFYCMEKENTDERT